MRKQKKFIIQILIFLSIILSASQVFATTIVNYAKEIELSDSYEEYLGLSEEEQENLIIPRMYDVSKTKMKVTNPLSLSKMLGTSNTTDYTLRDFIPENLVIKNQYSTNSCWTFSTLATLETTLALKDFKNEIEVPVVYDFSERHMEYATSKTFLDNETNEKAFNREAGSGGNTAIAMAYLTNGTGPVAEELDKKFIISKPIYISEIQNQPITAQIYDTINFPAYSVTDNLTKIKQQMKNHIMNYGGITAAIHAGSAPEGCFDSNTGKIYCNDSSTHKMNHAVTIIGWNDKYDFGDFYGNEPENKGAWIVKNSYGTGTELEDGTVIKMGDEGFMYVSYEDVNIYRYLTGIMNADTEVTYDNIYQYDEYGGYLKLNILDNNTLYFATIFEKETDETEYITQVSINASETYNCKVYINPNGTSKSMDDLQPVQLKAGESETFDAGYHTIEFLEPVKIEGDNFVVVLEVTGTKEDAMSLMMEFNYGEFFTAEKYKNAPNHMYDNVTIADGKCFITTLSGINSDSWDETSKMYTLTSGGVPNFDTTIKAFTITELQEVVEDEIDDEVELEETEKHDEVEVEEIEKDDESEEEQKQEEILLPQPENSNFDNMEGNVKNIKSYNFTKTNQKQYTVLDIELSNIIQTTENDKIEYYYYLSPNQKETNIENWVKIGDLQKSDGKLSFKINTLDISNYEEVSVAENLYLYIKEVATRNNVNSETVTTALILEVENIDIEEYLDGKKKADVNSEIITEPTPAEQPDDTLAKEIIPNAGKNIFIICLIFIMLVLGRLAYSKYKDIQI